MKSLNSSTALACALLAATAASSSADLVVVCNGGGSQPEPLMMSFEESSGQPVTRFSAFTESFEGVTRGGYGELYVTCNTLGVGEVVRFSPNGQFLGSFAEAHLTTPGNVTVGRDGNLYVIGSTWPNTPARGHIVRYNGETGEFIDYFVDASRGRARVLTDLAFGPQGHLYVAEFNKGILRYNGRNGQPLGLFAAVVPGQFDSPTALTFGPGGNLFVASHDLNAVLKFRGRDGTFLGAFVPPYHGGLVAPMGLCFGPDGNLYVSSYGTHKILKYHGRTGRFMANFATAESGLAYPTHLMFTEATTATALQ